MKNFYANLGKNSINRFISLILMICLIVTSVCPVNVFAYDNQAGSSASYIPPDSGGWTGAASTNSKGGYRFTLLFLAGDTGDILDRVGNVNIDKWAEYQANIVKIGTLDVAYDGYDSRDNYYFMGSAFDYELTGEYDRLTDGLKKGDRNLKFVSDLKDLAVQAGYMDAGDTFNFSWQINETTGKSTIGDVISTIDTSSDSIIIDLYPDETNTFQIPKHVPTVECATIIKALCQSNTNETEVLCESAEKIAGRDISSAESVFEQGTYKNQVGSYKLLIEPYEVIKFNGRSMALTLRDSIWYCNRLTGTDGRYGGVLANDVGSILSLMAKVNYMPHKDIFELNNHLPYQDVDTVDELPALSMFEPENYSPHRAKMKELNSLLEHKYGYGISSFSSDMCNNKSHPMFLGSVTNVFLPGTVMDGGTLNTETKSYSMEYRGEKSDETLQYLDDITKLLVDAINEGTEPANLAGTKAAITANNTNSLFASGTLDDGAYKALTDSISAQIDTSQIRLWNYDSKIKELAKNLITNDNFKDFITQTYFQNVFGTEYAILAEKNLQQNALTDWCKMLVLQTMLETGESNTTIANDDTAIAIMPSDLDSSNRHIGIKILNNDD